MKPIVVLGICILLTIMPVGISTCDCENDDNNESSWLTLEDIENLQERGKREGWTFTVGVNSATSRSISELCGLIEPENWWEDADFDPMNPTLDIPDEYDWRDYDGVTSVKNQGSCGSCWAFGTVGPLECNILIKDGIEVDLSEQWLVSCNSDGWSCGGGWWAHNYHQFKTDPCGGTGAVLEEYFPYQARNLPCDCPYPHDYLIDDWSFVGMGQGIPSVSSIKQAIMQYGPVSVAIAVDSAFGGYSGGVFNHDSSASINHAVVLVGWDDNQGENGVWYLRNSWGPGWGEDGYMRIEYGKCQVGYAACYVDYPGQPKVLMSLPEGSPEYVSAGSYSPVLVKIEEVTDNVVPGSETLNYRINSGSYQTSPLIPLGDGFYEAILPPLGCGDRVDYYLSIEGLDTGTIYKPHNAPSDKYRSSVGERVTIIEDNFENDNGWTVVNDDFITDGQWELGIPAGGGDRGDPPNDYDGSGKCYLTANRDGDSDVDNGATTLISPSFDLTGLDQILIHYALWYTNSYSPDNPDEEDYFNVFLSDDDGENYLLADTIGPDGTHGWFEYEIALGDLINPSNQVKILFEVSDQDESSLIEAAIDAFSISIFDCVEHQPPENPDAPTGPTNGFINQDYEFCFDGVVDPNGDNVFYQFIWGEGGTSQWYGPYPSGTQEICMTYSWSNGGDFAVRVRAKDTEEAITDWSAPLNVVINSAPLEPDKPTGPSTGKTNTQYTFQAETIDPDGEDVSYLFDWGDGTNSGWTSYVDSGEEVERTKKWNSGGLFQVKVKAKDTHGQESDWSNIHTIKITSPKPKLSIGPVTGGNGITVKVENSGDVTASGVTCTIFVNGGLFVIPNRINENIGTLSPGESVDVKKMVFGLGLGIFSTTPKILVTVSSSVGGSVEYSETAKIVGTRVTIL